jgi:hypothetical protein
MFMVLDELWFGHIIRFVEWVVVWCELILEVSGTCRELLQTGSPVA